MRNKKWETCRKLIKQYIQEENLTEGMPLPSDQDFAAMANCSVQPVIRAMNELVRSGEVQRRAGGTTRVLSRHPKLGQHLFSFSTTAHHFGYEVENRLCELSWRLPQKGDHYDIECEAQNTLGIKENEPFLIIERLRLLDAIPSALQQVFLNPAHFPDDFRSVHDFQRDSLLDIYKSAGINVQNRDTLIQARFPTEREASLLRLDSPYIPLLSVKQVTQGIVGDNSQLTPIEWMHAIYRPGWEYKVSNRTR